MNVEVTYTNNETIQLTYDGTFAELHAELLKLSDLGNGHFASCGLKLIGGVMINSNLIRQIKEI